MTVPEPGSSRRRPLLPGGADAAIWSLVDASTRRLADQTVETLRGREIVAKLAERYQHAGTQRRAGHLFEVMHALSFNRDAIAKGEPVRARVTEWLGEQTAPADLRLIRGDRLLGEAQAKLYECAGSAAHDLAHDRYEGMQRLVAADKVEHVSRYLDKRLTLNPEGVRYADFADARAHLTDSLHAGEVRSTPISTDEAHRAAEKPVRWANGQLTGDAARQVRSAALSGAAAGAVVSGLVEAGTQAARVRAGETSAAAAACSAAGAAARGAARSGALSGLGEAVRIAASTGVIPQAFGGGTLPGAVTGAVCGVAQAGMAFARGEIDACELAARSCESTLQTGLVWACGAVGQTVLPVPVVGALAGGLVGQMSATVIAQGLQFAIAAARENRLGEARIEVLEAEARTAVATAALLGEAERSLGQQRNAYVTSTVGPLLDDALRSVAAASADEALAKLTALTQSFAGQPLFVTVDEFDTWMHDSVTALTLDPNWA